MKKILVILLIILHGSVIAQKQNNYWYFGNGIGLDFNFNPPKTLAYSGLNTYEGCSSISDNNGNLLFYTNGVSVFNKNHQLMLGGTMLAGSLSSTNSVVTIPMPNNSKLFYLFTIGAAMEEASQLTYSIVDITGDNGLGQVIEKNTLVDNGTIEKLAAVQHCNKIDYWIVIRKWDSDEYHAYLLTELGVSSTPVISHTGLFINGGVGSQKHGENNALGTLKFNQFATKLVAAHAFDFNLIELMDFDNSNGVISNPIILNPNITPPPLIGVYGAEFSSNGKMLYISSNNSAIDPSIIYQYDISSNNSFSIEATKNIIAQPKPWDGGAIQMGPDQKIYLSTWKDSGLSVIENPDIYGIGCNFQFNKIIFHGFLNVVQYGLPSIIATTLNSQYALYDFNRTGSCNQLTIPFQISNLVGLDSVKWDFGDGQFSTQVNPTHTYSTTNHYNVTLITYTTGCSGVVSQTINHSIWITSGNETFLGNDTAVCDLSKLKIGYKNLNAQYLWSTGSTSDSILVITIGKYWLQLKINGCIISDTINISQLPKPTVKIKYDTLAVCLDKKIALKAISTIAYNYLWSTNETSQTIIVNETQKYKVTVGNFGCSSSDSVQVINGDCDIYLPNAFSPNGDNKNDYFGVINDFNSKSFSMQIIDRWGTVIFNSENSAKKWDGKYKGKPMPNGAYSWFILYTNSKGYKRDYKGIVMLLR